jgi:hypothetical protein
MTTVGFIPLLYQMIVKMSFHPNTGTSPSWGPEGLIELLLLVHSQVFLKQSSGAKPARDGGALKEWVSNSRTEKWFQAPQWMEQKFYDLIY